jgi:SAM-dependent methyltransferase
MLMFCPLISVCAQDLTETFEMIYSNGFWDKDESNQGTSGLGSKLINVIPYINLLEDFISKNHITSIVDAGCGDWQFSRYLNFNGINYLGVDAAKSVVLKNIAKYKKDNIQFVHGNFLEMELPKADLLILKDVLQHLSNKNILKAIDSFKNYRYVIAVNDISSANFCNYDIQDGGYRCLDLSAYPFFLKGQNLLTYKAVEGREVKRVFLIDNTLNQ